MFIGIPKMWMFYFGSKSTTLHVCVGGENWHKRKTEKQLEGRERGSRVLMLDVLQKSRYLRPAYS
jgi:hypothetical protein